MGNKKGPNVPTLQVKMRQLSKKFYANSPNFLGDVQQKDFMPLKKGIKSLLSGRIWGKMSVRKTK